METSVRQLAAGATDVAAECMLQYLDSFRSRLNEDLRLCTQEIQGARRSAAAFGPPGPVQHVMGQIQGLWERVGVRQNRIDALIEEEEQARSQCDQMATAQTNAQREIGQLRAANDQLQQDNDPLRQELLAARATPRPSQPSSTSSGSSKHSRLTDQERVKQLTADNNRIRGEREALRKYNDKLKGAIAEWKANAYREKVHTDATVDRLLALLQEAEDKLRQPQGQPPSRLPSHQEMGGSSTLPACC